MADDQFSHFCADQVSNGSCDHLLSIMQSSPLAYAAREREDQLRREEQAKNERDASIYFGDVSTDEPSYSPPQVHSNSSGAIAVSILGVAVLCGMFYSWIGSRPNPEPFYSKPETEEQVKIRVRMRKDEEANRDIARTLKDPINTPSGRDSLKKAFSAIQKKSPQTYVIVQFNHNAQKSKGYTMVLVPPMVELSRRKYLYVCVMHPFFYEGQEITRAGSDYLPFDAKKQSFTRDLKYDSLYTPKYKDILKTKCEQIVGGDLPSAQRKAMKTYSADTGAWK